MGATLDNVKAGDKVIFSNGFIEYIVTVTKVTKTQIHTGNSKYRKFDGKLVGSGAWDRSRISIYSEEAENRIKQAYKKNEMIVYLKNYQYGNLSFENIEKVYNHLSKLKMKTHTLSNEDLNGIYRHIDILMSDLTYEEVQEHLPAFNEIKSVIRERMRENMGKLKYHCISCCNYVDGWCTCLGKQVDKSNICEYFVLGV